MPGGAIGGPADIIDWLDYDAAHAAGREHVNHHGTHNAHPVSAAAGIATLNIIKGDVPSAHPFSGAGGGRGFQGSALRDSNLGPCEKASATAARLRKGMNEVLEEEGLAWAVYGEHSFFHIHSNPRGDAIRPTTFDASSITPEMLKGRDEAMLAKLRLAMLNNGVDLKGWRGGILSSAHTQADIDLTLAAWRKSLRALKDEAAIRGSL